MRSLFPEFYLPTDAEFEDLWQRCLFAFDANVLLNFYFYSRPTTKTFTTVLRLLKSRLWLPYQAGLEYQRNRVAVISKVVKSYAEADKTVESLLALIQSKSQPPFLKKKLSDKLVDALLDAGSDIEGTLEDLKELVKTDSIRDELDELFGGKVGARFDNGRLQAIYGEGKTRYKDRVPPGYKDEKDKPGNEMFGDLVIWKELIEKAKAEHCPVIFVTDDGKEDWWHIHEGRTLGPRPELLREFTAETGEQCYLYNSESFLRFADQHLSAHVDAAALNELGDVRERDRLLTFEMGYEHLNLPHDEELDALWEKLDALDTVGSEYWSLYDQHEKLSSERQSEAFDANIHRRLSPAARAKRAELVEAIGRVLAECRETPLWNWKSEDKLPEWLERVPEKMIPYASLPKLTTIRTNLEEYLRRHQEPPKIQEQNE